MFGVREVKRLVVMAALFAAAVAVPLAGWAQSEEAETEASKVASGKRLFAREEFGGNGRTCQTCHDPKTGTVSPEQAQARFAIDPNDALFLHDGSDDGKGNGATRMLEHATVLVEIPLPPNVRLADDPDARSVVLRRGIPSTLNTPALDPILMSDGREPDLETQARNAIRGHAQNTVEPSEKDLARIADFERSRPFFSSRALRAFARKGLEPELPEGVTETEKRGKRFFEDTFDPDDPRVGSCAACHSGPMLNATNQFLPLPVPVGSRFQNILVSELNEIGNPVRTFIFTNPDGTETTISSPDPGRALVTGDSRTFPFDNVNAFKIPTLWGANRTAPYFHDNSAKTLEDVARHYKKFFEIVSTPAGGGPPALSLSDQDMADIVAYTKLLE